MADLLKPDLCIIGAGALGISLALRARQLGLAVALLDQGVVVPGDGAKNAAQGAALLASANRAHAIRSSAALGMGTTDPKLNYRAIGERAQAVASAMHPDAAPERRAALGIMNLEGPAAFTDRQTLAIGDVAVRAGLFVLATGARPVLPDLQGLTEVPFFTPDSIVENMRKLSHVLVLGGGPEAVELAQAYARLGAEVTLVPQGPLLPGFDPELVAILLRTLREEGIDIVDGASVTAIVPRRQGTGVTLLLADGSPDARDVSHILVAMGRVPELDGALLAQARLRPDPAHPDRPLLSREGRTSNARILAIGGAAAVHDPAMAQAQLEAVLHRALGHAAPAVSAQRVPHLVATTPPLAQIGLVQTAKGLRSGQAMLRASLSETVTGQAAGEISGTASLIVSAKGAILGGAMLGPGAEGVMAMLAMALDRGMGASDLASLALPATSPAAVLTDMGRQFRATHPLSGWARLRARLPRRSA
jgi:pyruvate/2-oxoglutarate dehydrogenase complex dihydrolipoamide dehydrogenase (E3) component